jgi:hypothetical protein
MFLLYRLHVNDDEWSSITITHQHHHKAATSQSQRHEKGTTAMT